MSGDHHIQPAPQTEQDLRISEERYRYISDTIMGIVYSCTKLACGDYGIDWITGAVERIWGYTPEEILQQRCWKFLVHPDDMPIVDEQITALSPGKTSNCELRIIHKDGSIRWIRAFSRVVASEYQDVDHRLFGGFEDITERKHAEEQQQLAASVFDHAHEGIVITDTGGAIVDVNPAFSDITGYLPEEVKGKNPRLLKSDQHPPEFYAEMWHTLVSDGLWRGEIWNRKKNGEVYPELLTISAVSDAQGKTRNYVAVFTDITDYKEHQQHLENLAHFDPLTQLPNRALLSDRLQMALAQTRRSEKLLAVCYLDLDGFKPVNDRLGHEAGDRLLVEVAKRLKKALREGDTVGRLGGDEFVLLLAQLDNIEMCEHTLGRVLQAISGEYDLGGTKKVQISGSIGVTLFPFDDAAPDMLLRHADQAMYQAKQAGRNRYHLFDIAYDRNTRAHLEACLRIEQALGAGEFCLHYQPKVDLLRGEVVGLEALIRWQHPERGMLPPAEFLPVIDKTRFSLQLGDWVLAEVLSQMKLWQQAGIELPVSINISGFNLQDHSFTERLGDMLTSYAAATTQKLELEILETTALEDIKRASSVIEQCKALGLSVALDDFGTGYSSLTYLKRLPADILKIDRSFVRDMLDDPGDLAIIQGVIGLASAFGKQVIAEGVESGEQGAKLVELGCHLAQGYGICRPIPADSIPSWLGSFTPDPCWSRHAHTRH